MYMQTGRPCGLNSSLMLWRAGAFRGLSAFLRRHPAAVQSCVHKFDHFLEMMLPPPSPPPPLLAAGVVVERARVVYVQEAMRRRCPGAPAVVIDYAAITHRTLADGDVDAPAGAAVVCFPLKPKPHELEHAAPALYRRWRGLDPSPPRDGTHTSLDR